MKACSALAPAKVNLGLFLGPGRAQDAKHELVTVMQSISLCDVLTLEPAHAGAVQDEVLCPGVPGPAVENLAAVALSRFREATAWGVGPLRLSVVKRIPLAAGLGGGSADAAAALRLARHASGLGDEALLRELGAEIGADVPAQVSPGCWLATGAGERLHALPSPALRVLVLPLAAELSAADVYAEADRLRLARDPDELERCGVLLRAAFELGSPLPAADELLRNDLQPAAISLCPDIRAALSAARGAGALEAFVSGSGPTVVGLFASDAGAWPTRPAENPADLGSRVPAPIYAHPVDAGFARPRTLARQGA
jgi:4-diphosphocytidyl-2-C-methyl-D-erythritol kinase